MNLTAHFTVEELTRSEIALRKGLDNTPDEEASKNLKVLAMGLERVRGLLGQPMHINSGYRSKIVNDAVGSKDTSAHRKGFAADFVCPGYGSPIQICKAIRDSEIPYDQLIHEFGSWVHISFDPQLRGQVLTIDSNGTRQGI